MGPGPLEKLISKTQEVHNVHAIYTPQFHSLNWKLDIPNNVTRV